MVSALKCHGCTLRSCNRPSSPYCMQGFLLKAFQLPGLPGPAGPAAMPHNLKNEHFFVVVHKNGTSSSLSRGSNSLGSKGLILRHTLRSVMRSPYRVNWMIVSFVRLSILRVSIHRSIRTTHKELQDSLGRKAMISKYITFTVLEFNWAASVYTYLLRWRSTYYQISPLPLSNPPIKKQLQLSFAQSRRKKMQGAVFL